MNIFVTSKCPKESAAHLDDKRVVKMVLESTQMLCTALNLNGLTSPYKSTHQNHPCNVWTRRTRSNWLWLLSHAFFLVEEYEKRYNKVHKCKSILEKIKDRYHYIPQGPLTSFVNCARNKGLGIDYTNHNDIFTAYQKYLNDRWDNDKRTPTRYGKPL